MAPSTFYGAAEMWGANGSVGAVPLAPFAAPAVAGPAAAGPTAVAGPAAQMSAQRPPGRSVVLYAPRGGVGTTTLACNLAAHVAATDVGHREGVALVDLDLPFGTAAGAFGVTPPRTLADLDGRPSPEQLRSVLVPTDCGVNLLAAPTDPLAAEGVSTEECLAALHYATGHHAWTIIDTGPYLTETTLAAIDGATAVVILISGDITAVGAARAALRTLGMLGIGGARTLLVAARMGARNALTAAELTDALGLAPAVQLPESGDVSLAARRGRLLARDWPDHDYARAVGLLADYLAPPTGVDRTADHRPRWHRLTHPFARGRPTAADPPDGRPAPLNGAVPIG